VTAPALLSCQERRENGEMRVLEGSKVRRKRRFRPTQSGGRVCHNGIDSRTLEKKVNYLHHFEASCKDILKKINSKYGTLFAAT
jgi:hypothetical protein